MKRLISIIFFFLFLFISSCELTETELNAFNPEISFEVTDHILQDYFVYSIAFDNNGTAWIGTIDGDLIRYNDSTTVFDETNSIFTSDRPIQDIEIDKNNNVWLATELGLIKYDHNEFKVYDPSNSPIVRTNIYSIAIDDNNSIWFNCGNINDGGLMYLHDDNWTFYTPDNSDLPVRLVHDITVDNNNNIWLINSYGSNFVIKISNGNWQVFDESDFDFDLYWFDKIKCDNNNNVYVSISYGASSIYDISRPNIIKYNGVSWQIITPENELGESLGYVQTIGVDKRGYLWASTYDFYGSFYNAVYDGNYWRYSVSPDTEHRGYVIGVDSYNTIWLGTAEGLYTMPQ